MKKPHYRKIVLFTMLLVAQTGRPATDQGAVDRIMRLRLEIEGKNNEWETKTKSLQAISDSALQRLSELEAQNAKSKASLSLLRSRIEAGEARLTRRQTLSTKDRDRLLLLLAKAEEQFKTRLSFRGENSLEETSRIRAALLNKTMSTDEASQALAGLIKAELKTARGLRLDRAQIAIDGVRRSVEIARLGEYSAIAAVPESNGDLSYRQIGVGQTDWIHIVAADEIKNVERIFSVARSQSPNKPAVIGWPLRFVSKAKEK